MGLWCLRPSALLSLLAPSTFEPFMLDAKMPSPWGARYDDVVCQVLPRSMFAATEGRVSVGAGN